MLLWKPFFVDIILLYKSYGKINYRVLTGGINSTRSIRTFKNNGINPNSLSSIEKRINKIKEFYEVKTLFHLAYILHNKKLLENTDFRNNV